ncbi:MAG: bifunctional (p)ppGpp synthetase/guanosine-3',5'-bis(diphosphate) 3'-pyrophosphohydrolase [Candidatus Melainabacteria bacterium HGW-Melainabacteria-1]|nr:MAG: bifunctional (p)ppGpp synthetase/guanosine-3',5'-bis(diphosphate) 3'-pyrophosphohydrolase [Candidatus Melainabacteria bacterium HGW-Melainabacteria-1]
MWNPEHYQRAIAFAGEAHAAQLYPGSKANYVVHLAQVTMEILHAWAQAPGDWDVDLAMQCALLHDCLEDTDTPYTALEAAFGERIAKGVQALSKDESLPKAERMLDSLNRIKSLGMPEIAMVKLADRITNLQAPPRGWDQAKIARYRDEAGLILAQLGHASDFLASRLQHKIAAYRHYIQDQVP